MTTATKNLRKAGRPRIYTVQATCRMTQEMVETSSKLAAAMPNLSVNEYYGECIKAINQMVLDDQPALPRLVIALRAIRQADAGKPTRWLRAEPRA